MSFDPLHLSPSLSFSAADWSSLDFTRLAEHDDPLLCLQPSSLPQVPSLHRRLLPCEFCESSLATHALSHRLAAVFAFKSSVRASGSGQVRVADLAFAARVMAVGEKTPLERRNCVVLGGDDVAVHVLCLTPAEGTGSLVWNQALQEVGFEPGLKFAVEAYVFAETGRRADIRIEHSLPQDAVVEIRRTGVKRPMQSVAEKHGDVEMDFVRNDAGNDAEHMLVPWEMHRESGCCVCGSQGKERLASGTAYGDTVAAVSFRCGEISGPKNLRQKAHVLSILGPGVPQSSRLLFKIYADSTIRRGKKSLRRNCVLFQVAQGLFLHIQCRAQGNARGSLKWTEEKKERFLAFEAELEYLAQILKVGGAHTDEKDFQLRLSLSSENSELVSQWTDLIASKSQSIGLRNLNGVFGSPLWFNQDTKLQEWALEPNVWNLSLNPALEFYAILVSSNSEFPSTPPIVRFTFQDVVFDADIIQFDRKFHRSVLIKIPCLFSTFKIQEINRRGENLRQIFNVLVMDDHRCTLWEGQFVFEIGLGPFT